MTAMATEESSQSQQSKWKGKAYAELNRATVEQVWTLLEDFFSIHKWLPGIDTCQPVEGVLGQSGCIRYCANTAVSESEEKKITTKWVKEKLLFIDPVERCFSYEVIENNIGMNSYIATVKLVQLSQAAIDEGCQIQWSFVSDPIEDLTFEAFFSHIQSIAQGMAQRMEDALCPVRS
ncbi:hypothetical protein NE237_030768 [Protea cynaroides]|uniref:Lachrymatory factor synthase n=1 Tax=Protea cynaroides TaxID=273540 RepID=A0A9Q0GVP3_9MAGN|nr:hypothetical protein NE237_030768 [Protea cynaroides]